MKDGKYTCVFSSGAVQREEKAAGWRFFSEWTLQCFIVFQRWSFYYRGVQPQIHNQVSPQDSCKNLETKKIGGRVIPRPPRGKFNLPHFFWIKKTKIPLRFQSKAQESQTWGEWTTITRLVFLKLQPGLNLAQYLKVISSSLYLPNRRQEEIFSRRCNLELV